MANNKIITKEITTDTVKFLHWSGTTAQFNLIISGSAYKNYVVFARLTDTSTYKIYAGQDTKGKPYIYDTCDCIPQKWTYGDTLEGWHDADASITNTVGQLEAGMTLRDIMDATNDGDFSRLIEKMLFAPSQIHIPVMPSGYLDSTFNSVSCRVILADGDGGYVKIVNENDPLDTSIIYLDNLDPSTSEAGLNTYNLEFRTNNRGKRLASNTNYVITVVETNETLSSAPVSDRKSTAARLAVSIYDSITYADNVANNYVTLNASVSINTGDYNTCDSSSYKFEVYNSLNNTTNTSIFSSDAELVNYINSINDASYYCKYTVKATYKAVDSEDETETSSASKDVSTGVIKPNIKFSIATVNGSTYSSSTEYELNTGSVAIAFKNHVADIDASIYVKDASGNVIGNCDLQATSITVPVSASNNVLVLKIYVQDCYGVLSNSYNIKVKYVLQQICYISYIDYAKTYYNDALGDEISAGDIGAPGPGEEGGPAYIFENTTDKSWNMGGELPDEAVYDFIIGNAVDDLRDVETLDCVEVDNVKYYKFVPKSTVENGSRYILAPSTVNITFYEGTDGNTKPSTEIIESYKVQNNYEYNEQVFDIYYCSPGNIWEQVSKDGCCFIKIN